MPSASRGQRCTLHRSLTRMCRVSACPPPKSLRDFGAPPYGAGVAGTMFATTTPTTAPIIGASGKCFIDIIGKSTPMMITVKP